MHESANRLPFPRMGGAFRPNRYREGQNSHCRLSSVLTVIEDCVIYYLINDYDQLIERWFIVIETTFTHSMRVFCPALYVVPEIDGRRFENVFRENVEGKSPNE